ncbi:MAG: hypothetical protein GEV06_18765 [Luteitalea sp.]|nr:hypothetical protein [Luteitalea sp.]
MGTSTDRRSFLKTLSAQSPRGTDRPIKLGFIGVGGRGSFHLDAALGIEGVEVPCLCDISNANLYQAKRWVEESGRPTPRLYNRSETDFERLCEKEELDAVLCATSWEWHVPVARAAMQNGKHAIMEVPLVLTVDEGWELIETFERTGKWATLGVEGFRSLAVTHMVQQGLFGEIRHAEGGYVHDLRLVKFDPEREPWRLHHSVERNGNQYPDHPMSAMMPQLDINHGDCFEYLVSMSSKAIMLNEFARFYYGKDHPYATKPMAQGDYNVTLIRTAGGKMVTLNFDTNTPHPRGFYRLQGTKGVWWSPHYVETQESRIYIEGRSPESHQWEPAAKYVEEYQHPVLKSYSPAPRRAALRGHGGASRRTPIEWHRMIAALREDRMPDWDVYDSVTSSVISPLSEQSVAMNGRPVDFPDFTKGKWKAASRWLLT